MKRTKLANRILPDYTKGEEIMNMVTHIVGGSLGVVALILCILKAALTGTYVDIIGASIYGASIIILYTISSVYHGLCPGIGKKVLQILDHCSIYLLIAGTYTPILLSAFLPKFPLIGWILLIFQWALGATAATLTAIDLKKYKALSMVCYIFMGWSVIFFSPQAYAALGHWGFILVLWGGIAYTIGAVLFAIGAKLRWFHCVFHLFVLLGSILHFLGIYLYVL